MQLHFYKYQGTGNDFIIIDNRQGNISLTEDQVAWMCHRRFGIGADGLMLLELEPGSDFRMVYYNSDGRTSSLCGNGSRCMAAFAARLGLIGKKARFTASDGPHDVMLNDDGQVSLRMSDVSSIEKGDGYYFLDTGSPHYVRFIEDARSLDVVSEGRKVRFSDRFNETGTNVNFMAREGDDFFVRTYERGVEDETLSCGTGVTACALVAAYSGQAPKNQCRIVTPGGVLEVQYEKVLEHNFYNIWLKGAATFVFEGDIRIPE